MATLNLIKRVGKRVKQRVGRGQSSGRGKTAGRGTKGQNARSGRKKRPEIRDIIKKIPKRRGFGKNRGRTVVGTRLDALPVSLGDLETLFDTGAEVSTGSLIERGVMKERNAQPVKIVGGGTLTKKLSVKGLSVSASARAAIEKAGGTIA
ncbi:MAG: 50S ribosomal protein L15 [Candidatus Kaiserbacteria bacterium]|nr:MAG: 50S ribosomal protein L15 [Candidatus Kaiserbacteria bacterium]